MSIVTLKNAWFKEMALSSRKLFKYPISLDIKPNERWAVTGSRKLDLLKVLGSQYIAEPAVNGRTYPFLKGEVWPSAVVQHVEFGNAPVKASHLSARYESYRDEFDQTLEEFLTSANPDRNKVNLAIEMFKLQGLGGRWFVGLSNGQNRRARLALAVLKQPRLLTVDEPFLGLDPVNRTELSKTLGNLFPSPHVILGLRYQDEYPSWLTNVAIAMDDYILQGTLDELRPEIKKLGDINVAIVEKNRNMNRKARKERTDKEKTGSEDRPTVIELDSITVAYRGEPVFSDLLWKVKQGERWHIRGENGTGKSTLLSLLTADHPKSWNNKVILFGEPRQTGKHNYFTINDQFGCSSPEIHSIFPKKRTVYEAVSNGYLSGSFLPKTDLTEEQSSKINALIKEFGLKGDAKFGELSVNDQKTVLFLRAVVKNPKILILDEAFSGMSVTRTEQCKAYVHDMKDTTVLAISHIEEEIPSCDKYLLLKKGGYEVHRVR